MCNETTAYCGDCRTSLLETLLLRSRRLLRLTGHVNQGIADAIRLRREMRGIAEFRHSQHPAMELSVCVLGIPQAMGMCMGECMDSALKPFLELINLEVEPNPNDDGKTFILSFHMPPPALLEILLPYIRIICQETLLASSVDSYIREKTEDPIFVVYPDLYGPGRDPILHCYRNDAEARQNVEHRHGLIKKSGITTMGSRAIAFRRDPYQAPEIGPGPDLRYEKIWTYAEGCFTSDDDEVESPKTGPAGEANTIPPPVAEE